MIALDRVVLDRIALGAVLLLPPLLLHAHGIAEGAIAVADICFLAHSAVMHDWNWARTPWLRVGWAWWIWMTLCSLPIAALGLGEGGIPSLVQGVLIVRFLVLIAAMEHTILRAQEHRRWLGWVVAASAAYIAVQVIFQFAFGVNMYGKPLGEDGELTGPFGGPRAGPPLVRILFPALVPAVAALLQRPGRWAVLGGYALLVAGAAVMVLIGQRMPLLLTLLGLVIVALLLPRLRPAMLTGFLVVGVLIAASPVVAPNAHHRLVSKFTAQIENFATSRYGELYARALEIGLQRPVTGLGAVGFRYGCPEPRYFRPSFDGREADGGGAEICWHHPHNYYFEILDSGGFVGLALFVWLVIAWLAPMVRALARRPEPVLVGLFAAAVIQLWPIASTTGFFTLPVAGWSFLLLGWGLAQARWGNAGAAVADRGTAPYIPRNRSSELS